MRQTTSATSGFEIKRKTTRKAEFLSRMDKLLPWVEFCGVIVPYYPKAGNGRPPIGLERMLRMYFVAHWFNLGDEACEDALYDIARTPSLEGEGFGLRLKPVVSPQWRLKPKSKTRSLTNCQPVHFELLGRSFPICHHSSGFSAAYLNVGKQTNNHGITVRQGVHCNRTEARFSSFSP